MWWECRRSPKFWSPSTRGFKVLGFSIATDMCLPDALEPVRIEDILAVANQAEAKLSTIVKKGQAADKAECHFSMGTTSGAVAPVQANTTEFMPWLDRATRRARL